MTTPAPKRVEHTPRSRQNTPHTTPPNPITHPQATDPANSDTQSHPHAYCKIWAKASAADAHAVSALVRRYYAAVAARDAARACALMYFIRVESLPEEYGRPPGPLYLRGAASCQTVLSRAFGHFHAQLTQPPTVKAVSVEGARALAMVTWSGLPAGVMEARRQGHAWKIDSVLAKPLP